MKSCGWVYLRANSGLVYPGSSLLSWLSLSPTNLLIRRIFPSLHTRDRRDLVPIQGSQSENWQLEGVKFLKLSRTYPGKKPPSFLEPTQGWCFCHAQPSTALAGDIHHASGDKSPSRGSNGHFSSTFSVTTTSSFPRFLN